MRVEYLRGQTVLGPAQMKVLEENNLVVVDAAEFLGFNTRFTELATTNWQLENRIAFLEASLKLSQQNQVQSQAASTGGRGSSIGNGVNNNAYVRRRPRQGRTGAFSG